MTTNNEKSFTDAEILGFVEDELQRDFNYLKSNLKGKAITIQEKMEYLIKRIENDDINLINDLGELQSIGVALDVMCARIGSVQNTLKLINDFKAAEKK